MTAENLSQLLLGIVGVGIQLAFMYVPKLKDWYERQTNKGLIMLGVTFGVTLIYFGLSCTSLAVLLGIVLTCNIEGAYLALQAFFLIAVSQQMTYLYTRNSTFFRTR